jgi:hypothetical protein
MCLLTLMSYYPKVEIFGALGLSYEFLFITARTLCHYVCELASSSNIQMCPCTHDYPVFPNMRKENSCYSTMLVGMS